MINLQESMGPGRGQTCDLWFCSWTCSDCATWPGIYGPQREKTCLRGLAKNTGTDQPAHPRRLISASDIHFLESIICKLATGEISIF